MSKSSWFNKTVVLLMAAALLSVGVPNTWAMVAAPAAGKGFLPVAPGALSGKILDVDGVSPQGGVLIKLLDGKGKLIAKATTDLEGSYVLKGLEKGEYTLVIAKGIKGKIVVSKDAQISSLTIKASQEMLDSEKPALLAFSQGTGHTDPDDLTAAGLTPVQKAWAAVIGVGAVVTGTVTAVVANNNGSDDNDGTR